MSSDHDRARRQLARIADVLGLTTEEVAQSLGRTPQPRSLAEDILKVTVLLSSLEDAEIRMHGVTMLENFVEFQNLKSSSMLKTSTKRDLL